MDTSMIRDLDASKEEYTLKVRIIRLWNFTAWANPQDIRGIGMISLDEQGDKIEYNVGKPHNIKWQKVLEEYEERERAYENCRVLLVLSLPDSNFVRFSRASGGIDEEEGELPK
ncbi:hypothetical protein LXL04_034944 [Taraxacum kok-saghyz]